MSQLTPSDLKKKLLTEPSFVVSFILDNNPEEVRERLTEIGYTVANKDEMIDAINDIIARGDMSQFTQALSVTLITENYDPIYDAAIEEAAEEIVNRMILKSNTTTGTENTESNFNINNILGIISGGITGYLQSGYNSVNPYNSTQYNPNPINSQTNSKSNTLYWIVGVLLLAVIIGVIIYFARKR